MNEVTLESLFEQLEKLQRRFDSFKEDWEELKHELRTFKNSNSSRTGYPGARGETGPAGKDAVLKVVQQGGSKITIVDALTEKPVAELVAIEGPAGQDGRDGKDGLPGESIRGYRGEQGPQGKPGRDGIDGKDGKDGRDGHTPSMVELERMIAEAQVSGALKHHELIKRG
jgi:hypothetical protein